MKADVKSMRSVPEDIKIHVSIIKIFIKYVLIAHSFRPSKFRGV